MRRDLEKYLATLQKQYDEMNKAAAEAQDLLTKGEMSAEQANMIQQFMNNIATNYNRILYCRYLVNLPPKFIQNFQNKKTLKEMQKLKEEGHDNESVINECQADLEGIKEQLPEKEVEEKAKVEISPRPSVFRGKSWKWVNKGEENGEK